jgi:competence protein ComEC
MHPYRIPVWKAAPFLRFLLPFITGILFQYYLQCKIVHVLVVSLIVLLFYSIHNKAAIQTKYKFRLLQGFLLCVFMIVLGMILTWHKDIRNDKKWFGHYSDSSSMLMVKLEEPFLQKNKSFKATASVIGLVKTSDHPLLSVTGKILLYFSPDTSLSAINYGSILLIRNNFQKIKSSGNPGGFNYEQYASFQQLFHQAFLKSSDFVVLTNSKKQDFKAWIFASQQKITSTLRKYLGDDKNVLGIAEALLIGYKEDLDKDLVQAYSNTGVVHIIAISGLHIGLIYASLRWLFHLIPVLRKRKLLNAIITLACLWIFALLTGASASVLRSAVMFSFIIGGECLSRKSGIYNSMAVSAFVLLCYDPFFLWDVGFQLSYLAVLGIVLMQQKIRALFFIHNAYLRKVWEMMAVTLAAQLTAFPICLYYFHQFPNLFFISNLVAVPLSTLILFAEILLLFFSWIPAIAAIIGKLVYSLIWLMNWFITSINEWPYAVADYLFAGYTSTVFLYAAIGFMIGMILRKNKKAMYAFLFFTGMYALLYAVSGFQSHRQKQMIVYNIPRKQAIDFIAGNEFIFFGDSALYTTGLLKNFHLRPSRILYRLGEQPIEFYPADHSTLVKNFYEKNILLLKDHTSGIADPGVRIDVMVVSAHDGKDIYNLLNRIRPSQVVLDASNSLWKIAKWKTACEALNLPCFSVPDEGAFVYTIK